MAWDEMPPTLDDERSRRSTDLALMVFGSGPVRRYELPPGGRVVIGRAQEADVRLSDPLASRRHAALSVGPGYSIEDLNSNNGTYLADEPISPGQAVQVAPGQLISIGSTLLSIRRAPIASEASAPAVMADPKTRAVYELVERMAVGEISVLIQGETGSGKELVAEAVHRGSRRADGPFVSTNCAALSTNLVESELFGHVQGAFTGADRDRRGLLEAASGGTLFLDEVGELDPALQAKLLRVIEKREVVRVGSSVPNPIDVRFVSATNRDLESEVDAGRFRRDLFFRLAAALVAVPPLRERPLDVEPLARRFAAEGARALGQPAPTITAEAIAVLTAQSWPGNIRELKNVIDRAILLGAGSPEIDASMLHLRPPSEAVTHNDERQRIVDALAACGGNQTKAAKMLGVSRRTLTNRLNQYGIPRPRK